MVWESEKSNDVMTVICICVMNKCNAINIQLHTFVVLVIWCNDTYTHYTCMSRACVLTCKLTNDCYKYCNACTINNLCLQLYARTACMCTRTTNSGIYYPEACPEDKFLRGIIYFVTPARPLDIEQLT